MPNASPDAYLRSSQCSDCAAKIDRAVDPHVGDPIPGTPVLRIYCLRCADARGLLSSARPPRRPAPRAVRPPTVHPVALVGRYAQNPAPASKKVLLVNPGPKPRPRGRRGRRKGRPRMLMVDPMAVDYEGQLQGVDVQFVGERERLRDPGKHLARPTYDRAMMAVHEAAAKGLRRLWIHGGISAPPSGRSLASLRKAGRGRNPAPALVAAGLAVAGDPRVQRAARGAAKGIGRAIGRAFKGKKKRNPRDAAGIARTAEWAADRGLEALRSGALGDASDYGYQAFALWDAALLPAERLRFPRIQRKVAALQQGLAGISTYPRGPPVMERRLALKGATANPRRRDLVGAAVARLRKETPAERWYYAALGRGELTVTADGDVRCGRCRAKVAIFGDTFEDVRSAAGRHRCRGARRRVGRANPRTPTWRRKVSGESRFDPRAIRERVWLLRRGWKGDMDALRRTAVPDTCLVCGQPYGEYPPGHSEEDHCKFCACLQRGVHNDCGEGTKFSLCPQCYGAVRGSPKPPRLNPALPYARGVIPRKVERTYPFSKVLRSMREQYGEERGRSIFYAWLRGVKPSRRLARALPKAERARGRARRRRNPGPGERLWIDSLAHPERPGGFTGGPVRIRGIVIDMVRAGRGRWRVTVDDGSGAAEFAVPDATLRQLIPASWPRGDPTELMSLPVEVDASRSAPSRGRPGRAELTGVGRIAVLGVYGPGETGTREVRPFRNPALMMGTRCFVCHRIADAERCPKCYGPVCVAHYDQHVCVAPNPRGRRKAGPLMLSMKGKGGNILVVGDTRPPGGGRPRIGHGASWPPKGRPHPRCAQPSDALYCTWCTTKFRCGDAPHDVQGPLCPVCGRGEKLELWSEIGRQVRAVARDMGPDFRPTPYRRRNPRGAPNPRMEYAIPPAHRADDWQVAGLVSRPEAHAWFRANALPRFLSWPSSGRYYYDWPGLYPSSPAGRFAFGFWRGMDADRFAKWLAGASPAGVSVDRRTLGRRNPAVVATEGGWAEVPSMGEYEDPESGRRYPVGQVWVGPGTRGFERGGIVRLRGTHRATVRDPKKHYTYRGRRYPKQAERRLRDPTVRAGEQFVQAKTLAWADLPKPTRETARRLMRKYGGSEPGGLTWGRTEIRPEVGRMVPIPRQAPGEMFTDFLHADAARLVAELRKLVGRPVILTGGGGTGLYWGLLERVRLECSPAALRDASGRIVRDAKGDWIPDPTRPEACTVIPTLRAFPGETIHGRVRWEPHIGSWRITALRGHGADALSPAPPGWEENPSYAALGPGGVPIGVLDARRIREARSQAARRWGASVSRVIPVSEYYRRFAGNPAFRRKVLGPHGAFAVDLVEDERAAANRIYEIREQHVAPRRAGRIGVLGSEVGSLARWWPSERRRRMPRRRNPTYAAIGEEGLPLGFFDAPTRMIASERAVLQFGSHLREVAPASYYYRRMAQRAGPTRRNPRRDPDSGREYRCTGCGRYFTPEPLAYFGWKVTCPDCASKFSPEERHPMLALDPRDLPEDVALELRGMRNPRYRVVLADSGELLPDPIIAKNRARGAEEALASLGYLLRAESVPEARRRRSPNPGYRRSCVHARINEWMSGGRKKGQCLDCGDHGLLGRLLDERSQRVAMRAILPLARNPKRTRRAGREEWRRVQGLLPAPHGVHALGRRARAQYRAQGRRAVRNPGRYGHPEGRLRGLLRRLKASAEESARLRGHALGPWLEGHTKFARRASCSRCGREVVVNTWPAPNEIDIGGEAVAVGCGTRAANPQPVAREFTCPRCRYVHRTVYYAPWAECTGRPGAKHPPTRMRMRKLLIGGKRALGNPKRRDPEFRRTTAQRSSALRSARRELERLAGRVRPSNSSPAFHRDFRALLASVRAGRPNLALADMLPAHLMGGASLKAALKHERRAAAKHPEWGMASPGYWSSLPGAYGVLDRVRHLLVFRYAGELPSDVAVLTAGPERGEITVQEPVVGRPGTLRTATYKPAWANPRRRLVPGRFATRRGARVCPECLHGFTRSGKSHVGSSGEIRRIRTKPWTPAEQMLFPAMGWLPTPLAEKWNVCPIHGLELVPVPNPTWKEIDELVDGIYAGRIGGPGLTAEAVKEMFARVSQEGIRDESGLRVVRPMRTYAARRRNPARAPKAPREYSVYFAPDGKTFFRPAGAGPTTMDRAFAFLQGSDVSVMAALNRAARFELVNDRTGKVIARRGGPAANPDWFTRPARPGYPKNGRRANPRNPVELSHTEVGMLRMPLRDAGAQLRHASRRVRALDDVLGDLERKARPNPSGVGPCGFCGGPLARARHHDSPGYRGYQCRSCLATTQAPIPGVRVERGPYGQVAVRKNPARCRRCGRPMGPVERMVADICGRCVREVHAETVRGVGWRNPRGMRGAMYYTMASGPHAGHGIKHRVGQATAYCFQCQRRFRIAARNPFPYLPETRELAERYSAAGNWVRFDPSTSAAEGLEAALRASERHASAMLGQPLTVYTWERSETTPGRVLIYWRTSGGELIRGGLRAVAGRDLIFYIDQTEAPARVKNPRRRGRPARRNPLMFNLHEGIGGGAAAVLRPEDLYLPRRFAKRMPGHIFLKTKRKPGLYLPVGTAEPPYRHGVQQAVAFARKADKDEVRRYLEASESEAPAMEQPSIGLWVPAPKGSRITMLPVRSGLWTVPGFAERGARILPAPPARNPRRLRPNAPPAYSKRQKRLVLAEANQLMFFMERPSWQGSVRAMLRDSAETARRLGVPAAVLYRVLRDEFGATYVDRIAPARLRRAGPVRNPGPRPRSRDELPRFPPARFSSRRITVRTPEGRTLTTTLHGLAAQGDPAAQAAALGGELVSAEDVAENPKRKRRPSGAAPWWCRLCEDFHSGTGVCPRGLRNPRPPRLKSTARCARCGRQLHEHPPEGRRVRHRFVAPRVSTREYLWRRGMRNPATLEDAWQRGKRMALERFGAETRDWDQVLMGISEMLKERGAPHSEYGEIGDLWHYPTAGYTDPNDTPDKVIKDLEGALASPFPPRQEYVDPLDTGRFYWRTDRARRSAPDRAGLEYEAKSGLDTAIKGDHPTLRRGTREWNRIWAETWPRAVAYYKRQAEQNRAREVESLKQWFESEGRKDADSEIRGAERNLTRVAHVEALRPGSGAAAKARAATEARAARARAFIKYHEGVIAELASIEIGRGPERGPRDAVVAEELAVAANPASARVGRIQRRHYQAEYHPGFGYYTGWTMKRQPGHEEHGMYIPPGLIAKAQDPRWMARKATEKMRVPTAPFAHTWEEALGFLRRREAFAFLAEMRPEERERRQDRRMIDAIHVSRQTYGTNTPAQLLGALTENWGPEGKAGRFLPVDEALRRKKAGEEGFWSVNPTVAFSARAEAERQRRNYRLFHQRPGPITRRGSEWRFDVERPMPAHRTVNPRSFAVTDFIEGRHHCARCGRELSSAQALRNHMVSVHMEGFYPDVSRYARRRNPYRVLIRRPTESEWGPRGEYLGSRPDGWENVYPRVPGGAPATYRTSRAAARSIPKWAADSMRFRVAPVREARRYVVPRRQGEPPTPGHVWDHGARCRCPRCRQANPQSAAQIVANMRGMVSSGRAALRSGRPAGPRNAEFEAREADSLFWNALTREERRGAARAAWRDAMRLLEASVAAQDPSLKGLVARGAGLAEQMMARGNPRRGRRIDPGRLDPLEQRLYAEASGSPEHRVKVLIDTVEGDWSQLSPYLRGLAGRAGRNPDELAPYVEEIVRACSASGGSVAREAADRELLVYLNVYRVSLATSMRSICKKYGGDPEAVRTPNPREYLWSRRAAEDERRRMKRGGARVGPVRRTADGEFDPLEPFSGQRWHFDWDRNPRRTPRALDAYLGEVISYGGIPTRRGDAIRDMQRMGLTRPQIDAWLIGHERSAKNPGRRARRARNPSRGPATAKVDVDEGALERGRRRSDPAVRAAIAKFQEFHAFGAKKVQQVSFPNPKVLVRLGNWSAVGYDSHKWTGKHQAYIHEFEDGVDRTVAFDPTTSTVVAWGRARVTERGIEDLKRAGRRKAQAAAA